MLHRNEAIRLYRVVSRYLVEVTGFRQCSLYEESWLKKVFVSPDFSFGSYTSKFLIYLQSRFLFLRFHGLLLSLDFCELLE
jgi:hypothetical protein